MCPVCISTAAILAYGTGATAGAAALVVGTRRALRRAFAPRRDMSSANTVPPSAEPVSRAVEK